MMRDIILALVTSLIIVVFGAVAAIIVVLGAVAAYVMDGNMQLFLLVAILFNVIYISIRM
jgi:hypothetical protein